MSALGARAGVVRQTPGEIFGPVVGGAGICALALFVSYSLPHPSIVGVFSVVGIGAVALWMFFSTRYELTLLVLMIYLGCLDGYIKLKTNTEPATLLRDVLLYAIVIGALVRGVVRRERLDLPPLSGWIIAFCLIVLVQVFNPGSGDWSHAVPSVRPHLEFVPLFFLGYAIMRSTKRLRAFLLLLLAMAAINGVVSLIQFNLDPEQFASWGPGYAERIEGTGDVGGRAFQDEENNNRTRPFGLGSDAGFGGILGLIAVPAGLALLGLTRRTAWRIAAAVLLSGAALGIVTSQARVAVVGSVVAALAFVALAAASRRAAGALVALGVGGLVALVAISMLTGSADESAFGRYDSISPGDVAQTSVEYRQNTIARIPDFAGRFPLGAGLGSGGPAAGFGGESATGGLDAESTYTYLIIELGLPGLLLLLALYFNILVLFVPRVRKLQDPELRLLLAALVAGLFALFVTWYVGIVGATTPSAPFLWFSAGTLTYWFSRARKDAQGGPEHVSA